MVEEKQFVPMGYVRGAYGVKGWLKIKTDTEYPDSLAGHAVWYLGNGEKWTEFAFAAGKIAGDAFLAKLEGIDDRDRAEALRGMTVAVPRAGFAETAEGEYYWVDLVGLKVVNAAGATLGVVEGLMESGAHDILQVRHDSGRQILIPFVAKFIGDIDRAGGIIRADWEADY